MASHSAIIRYLGGIRKVAQALGHANHTTVQGWSDRNRIPVERWSEIVAAASGLGATLSASDLMPADLRPIANQPKGIAA